ncbi:CRISPR-associated protein Cas5 [Desulfofundulus sp. TPOSR]|uniref:CRISPR-associated protein Cas5 n=1 Tax=Desulfofundulus sp. TPOSR TaxID=2714340 RepID=UPI00140DBAFD|nr:CRISPR-associated protein Cas5 [Desulfofundulus sp. TPOSR]NHM27774.1 CRISPR-associated protein Cas5 [Desulfofundulus sp. TPOSR]
MTDYLKVLIFSLRGKTAHFRQPDTIITQATYPFPPRPTLHGLLASVLGINFSTREGKAFLNDRHFIGLSLLSPVRTVCVQMSLLGKGFVSGEGDFFNRPTVVEMVVDPRYRVYYAGKWVEELSEKIRANKSVYHTYLGSAYCLTFPEYEDTVEARVLQPVPEDPIPVHTVVPRELTAHIALEAGAAYAAARAMPYQHCGGRIFERTVTVLYEEKGETLKVRFKEKPPFPYLAVELPGGEVACLW